MIPEEHTHFDNEGHIVNRNRATRRRKPMRARQTIIDYIHVPENIYTKVTHKIKKMRKKNAQTKQQRQRTVAKARKARKAYNTQVS